MLYLHHRECLPSLDREGMHAEDKDGSVDMHSSGHALQKGIRWFGIRRTFRAWASVQLVLTDSCMKLSLYRRTDASIVAMPEMFLPPGAASLMLSRLKTAVDCLR